MKRNQILSETTKPGSLLGMEINGKIITDQTKNEDWTGDFDCYNNNLTSLEHTPRLVGGNFSCFNNNLTSLEYAPRSVGGYFSCYDNNITSLHNIHKRIQQMSGIFHCYDNPITKQILGVLLIKGCAIFNFRNDINKIVNKYLPNTRGMVAVSECQDELIEAGLEDFAEL